MIIRPFAPADRDACLAVFDSNVPEFFRTHERAGFAAFLDDLPGLYLVVVDDGEIVACGGIAESMDGEAIDVCWGMVRHDRHGEGIGSLLLDARVARARDLHPRRPIRMNTIPETTGFFEKHGFRTVRVTRDGYGPGMDRCDMEIAPPARSDARG